MWRIACQDFRDTAESCIVQVVLEWPQQSQRGLPIAVDTIVSLGVCTHQPAPHSSLVVCTISPPGVTSIVALIEGIIWTQGAQAVAGKECLTNSLDNRFCLAAIQQGK